MKNLLALCCLLPAILVGQNAKMTPEVYEIWNKIEKVEISESGNWLHYLLSNEAGKSEVHLQSTRTDSKYFFEDAKKGRVDKNESFFVCLKGAPLDSIKALKRKKVKKKNLPPDTLYFLSLKTDQLKYFPAVNAYKMPKDGGDVLAISHKERSIKVDSTLVKPEGKKNGTKLTVMNINFDTPLEVSYVKGYEWADNGSKLAIYTTGKDTLNQDQLLIYNAKTHQIKSLATGKGRYINTNFNSAGNRLACIHEMKIKKDSTVNVLLEWNLNGGSNPIRIAEEQLLDDMIVSEHKRPFYLKHSEHLIMGVKPRPLAVDTTLLEEEIVNVDIWNYKEPLLHTRQKVNLQKEEKRTYLVAVNLKSQKVVQLSGLSNSECSLTEKHKGDYVLSYDLKPYMQLQSWEGHSYKDVYFTNMSSGQTSKKMTKVDGSLKLSPNGKYALWYSRSDTTWYSYDIKTEKKHILSRGRFYNELNDQPRHPWASGFMAWVKGNKILIYDHYDIWQLDLNGKLDPKRITKGREETKSYRYINLNKELDLLPEDTTVLLKYLDEDSKYSGLLKLELGTGNLSLIEEGPYKYASKILKAKRTEDLIYTKENFELFPDLLLSKVDFATSKQITDVNPQQKDYAWGSIEQFEWTDSRGNKRKALLAKPPGFDPSKTYPLIVNFYEKSSNRLYNHRAPYAHRSTINYSYYTNQGYVIFNPDIYYVDGYPGLSAYDAVMTSVDQLLEEGFVDEERMALQGHSWGGYQIAYILTKTDRFKCAESGAPVVNMTSAYGGIRWRTGRSRMFQYERTQSRIGANLWERPDLYLSNSPLFNMDKVNTPVLILHNDKDGAVPWYQGIEYFVALRRLGKPCWMLNYNDEPHWPVKKQNRLDFNIRMEQFFGHYLLQKPLPVWMDTGVPAVLRNKIDGLNYSDQH